MSNERLIQLAIKARTFSCADISKFKVGAALLMKSGEVFLGCNIEDPSGIGITNICAERCAVIKALSEGSRDFDTIAVVGGYDSSDELVTCMPCGACRQYLASFCPQIKIVCMGNNHGVIEYSLSELLPFAFHEKFQN